jgi:hypothetical protein
MKPRTLLVIASVMVPGTAFAESWEEPPLFFDIGMNTRHFNNALDTRASLRTTVAVEPIPQSGTALTGDIRFGAHVQRSTYVALEGEFGRLEQGAETNVAGAYAVLGARGVFGAAVLAVELATGWRSTSYSLTTEDTTNFIIEPRARADVWLSDRITFGASLGASLGERDAWLAGFNFGVHSLDFDGRR